MVGSICRILPKSPIPSDNVQDSLPAAAVLKMLYIDDVTFVLDLTHAGSAILGLVKSR